MKTATLRKRREKLSGLFGMMKLSMSSMTRFVKFFFFFMFSICVIAQAQEASVQEESFEVKTPDDVTLHGKLYVKSKETPLVILIHMLNRSEEDWKGLP